MAVVPGQQVGRGGPVRGAAARFRGSHSQLLGSCTDVTERCAVNKPGKSCPRPLADLLHKTLNDTFAKRGFASSRAGDSLGGDRRVRRSRPIREPEKIQWPRSAQVACEPGTLVLRVEGPTAVEIQHLTGVILERVNRFFGWQAIGGLRLRQAPLRRPESKPRLGPDPETAARIAADLPEIRDDGSARRAGPAGGSDQTEVSSWKLGVGASIATFGVSG